MTDDSRQYFTARWLEKLEGQLRSCTDPGRRGLLLAKKALGLARHSLADDAKQIILKLRAFNKAYEPQLSAWIMFAEGIIEHSESSNVEKAKDRILRAHLIAQVAKDSELAATAAAWMAYFCYVQGNYSQSIEYLDFAYEWLERGDTEGLARAAALLALAFSAGGDLERAKLWFHSARSYAIDGGDIAMQNIVLFNASAVHIARLTLEDCVGQVNPKELNFAVMSARSVANLNTAIGVLSLPSMIPLQGAELSVISAEWETADSVFCKYLDTLDQQGQARLKPRYHAQRAWCRANLDDIDGALDELSAAESSAEKCCDPDDKAVLYFRLAQTLQRLYDDGRHIKYLELGNHHLGVYKEHQAQILEKYSSLENRIPENKRPGANRAR